MRSPLDFGIDSDAPAHIAQASIDLLDPWDDFMLAEMQHPPASQTPAMFQRVCGYFAGHLDVVSGTSRVGQISMRTAQQRSIFGTEGLYSQVEALQPGMTANLEALDVSLPLSRQRLGQCLRAAMGPERASLFGRVSTLCMEAAVFTTKCALQDERHTHSVAMAVDGVRWDSGKRRLITKVLAEGHPNPLIIFQSQLMGYLFELAANSGIIGDGFNSDFYDAIREANAARMESDGIDMLGIALTCPWEVEVVSEALKAMDASVKAGLI